MKNKFFSASILRKGIVGVLGSMLLISCGAQLGYTETDGIYYDPNTDKIERKIAWQEPETYDYQGGIIHQSQRVREEQEKKYSNKNWGNEQKISTSDWGTYAGTQNNYYYNGYSAWDYPYYQNFYSPYYFGMYNSYFGNFYSGWNMGFPRYYWRNYYHPYYQSYYNYWGNRYYHGYNNWYYNPYYSPYYGYHSPYIIREYYPVRTYKRSGADPVYRGTQRSENSSWGRSQQHQRPQNRYPNQNSVRSSSWGTRRSNSNNRNYSQNSESRQSSHTPSNHSSNQGSWGREPSWGGSSNSGSGVRSSSTRTR
ncbi:MAG: hypothetical protein Q4A00_04480 [Flavobacteriaceae bacterium]|nr:hypothetical protein [Flavobacteriaceae bacterium]